MTSLLAPSRKGFTRPGLLAVAMILGIGLSLAFVPSARSAPAAQVSLEEDRPWECDPSGSAQFCAMNASHRAFPGVLLAGELLTVSMPTMWVCGSIEKREHIMLVVDTDASLSHRELRDAREALKRLVKHFDLSTNPRVRIGLVEVGERASLRVPLTGDEAGLLRAINRIEAEGDLRVGKGIEEGLRALRNGRSDLLLPEAAYETLIVFAPDAEAQDCPASWKRASSNAKSANVLLLTVCLSQTCEGTCLRSIAKAARYFYLHDEIPSIHQIFNRPWGGQGVPIQMRSLHLVENLSTGLEYLPDSAEPPAQFDPVSRALVWSNVDVPTGKRTITFTYQARAIGRGSQVVSKGSNFFWMNQVGHCGEMTMNPTMLSTLGMPELALGLKQHVEGWTR